MTDRDTPIAEPPNRIVGDRPGSDEPIQRLCQLNRPSSATIPTPKRSAKEEITSGFSATP